MEVTFAGVRYRTILRERRRADGGERTTTLATEVATLVERSARFAEPAARRPWRACRATLLPSPRALPAWDRARSAWHASGDEREIE